MRPRTLTRSSLVLSLVIALSAAAGTAVAADTTLTVEKFAAPISAGVSARAAESGSFSALSAAPDLTVPDAAWTTFRDLNLTRIAAGSDPVIRHGNLDSVAAQWASTQAANDTFELDEALESKLPAGLVSGYQLLFWAPTNDVQAFLDYLVEEELGFEDTDPVLTDSGIAIAKSEYGLFAYFILAEYPRSAPSTDEQPLYRFYLPGAGTHFYSTSPAERNTVIGYGDYRYEGLVAYIKAPTASPQSTVLSNLTRFHLRSAGTHFYTSSPAEHAAVLTYPQYSLDGVAGRVFTQPGTGLSAMHRFFRPASGTHFYSANPVEVEAVKAIPGYSYEGVAFYLRVAS